MIKPGDFVIIGDKLTLYYQCNYDRNQLWPFNTFHMCIHSISQLEALVISVVTYTLKKNNVLITVYCLLTSLGVVYTTNKPYTPLNIKFVNKHMNK